MPRYKESERDEARSQTRRLLLDAATEEFARLGYAGANVDHISKSAGYAKGTIYNYFESKRAIMLALIDEIADAHLDFITSSIRGEDDAVRRLERLYESGFAFVESHLTQALVLVNNLYGPDAEFKEAMYEAYLPMFELVGRDIIAYGVGQGVFRRVEPTVTARLLMNIYLGVASQVNEEGRPWFAPGQISDLLLNGLRL